MVPHMLESGTAGDTLLSVQDREEAVSRAFIQAVAAGAGYVVSTMDFDRDGVDIEIKAGGAMRPSISIQLKATVNLGRERRGYFHFPLRRRNYDLLREPTQVPRLLVVLDLPRDEREWVRLTADELTMRHRMFWLSLTGSPETDHKDSVTVHIPGGNLLNVGSLRELMEKSRTGMLV
jgi:hypothetical protein